MYECIQNMSKIFKNTQTGALFTFLTPLFTLMKISISSKTRGESNWFSVGWLFIASKSIAQKDGFISADNAENSSYVHNKLGK